MFIFVVHQKLTRFSPQTPFTSGSEMDLFGDLPEPTNDPGGLINKYYNNHHFVCIIAVEVSDLDR